MFDLGGKLTKAIPSPFGKGIEMAQPREIVDPVIWFDNS